jgi:hypothetical protein
LRKEIGRGKTETLSWNGIERGNGHREQGA